jgi:hypothetical protein
VEEKLSNQLKTCQLPGMEQGWRWFPDFLGSVNAMHTM